MNLTDRALSLRSPLWRFLRRHSVLRPRPQSATAYHRRRCLRAHDVLVYGYIHATDQ